MSDAASPATNTIAALASGRDPAGIAVVRVSGPQSRCIIRALIGRVPPARRAVHCVLRTGENAVIDEGLIIFFAGPASFTGEDVLEFHGHGSPVLVDMVLERMMELGARPAEPGEYSRRAFENNRLSLDQAEATADVIAAESRAAATAAMRSLQGEFARRAESLTTSLVQLRALIEGSLDFPDEDDIDWLGNAQVGARIDTVQNELAQLANEAGNGARLQEGLRVAILGQPNVGKSSLLNALSRRNSAIVTDIPGTTRDVLEEQVELAGVQITLVDTAGLRTTDNPIEIEGIRRARNAAEYANHVLYMFDAVQGLGSEDQVQLDALPASVGVTQVGNKIDLVSGSGPNPQYAERAEKQAMVEISALTGAGIDTLIHHLSQDVAQGVVQAATFSARRRHLNALENAQSALKQARSLLVETGDAELVADELTSAQSYLSEITGAVSPDAVLGEIFATFCIGK